MQRVVFTKDTTEWIVSLMKHEVDVVLRIKRRIKIKPRLKHLDDLDLVAIRNSDFTEQSEKLLLGNCKMSRKIAKKLYREGDYRDAFLYLHLSIEHLMKYLFAKTKYAYQKRYLDPMPIVDDGASGKIEFTHDVSIIAVSIIKITPSIASVIPLRPLLSTLAGTKKYGGWATIRYTVDPLDPVVQSAFKIYYQNLRSNFVPVLRDLKRKGYFQ